MSRLSKKEAIKLSEAMKMMLASSGLGPAHNTRRIFQAWDNASGAANYTQKRFFRNGRLYITLSSSVVRTHLSLQKKEIKDKMNGILLEDELFIRSGSERETVKDLILK